MKKYSLPKKEEWNVLSERPNLNQVELTKTVKEMINQVKIGRDQALINYTETFDGIKLDRLMVTPKEIKIASQQLSPALKQAIKIASQNISKFHQAQKVKEKQIETMPGVTCWRKSVAIQKVGLYIPGGSAPLFSTVLMLAIPAKIAGCKELILCTPPDKTGKINSAILYAADLVGITKIYKVGGAQAIAGMALGTETIPQVLKIFGPGNQYVTKAKELVQQQGTAIDLPAGPSEVLVIADETSNPAFVAADLLSQAEHGADSQVILLSPDQEVVDACLSEINEQIALLPRKEIALQSLEKSKAVVLNNMDDCLEFSNMYAPEHLIIASANASKYLEMITNAGSVFVGNFSCEAAGDYASGTNHTLPTNGFAKNYSGVSLDSFVKKITFQQLSKEGIKKLGPTIEILAEAEQLIAHKNAVTIRLKAIEND